MPTASERAASEAERWRGIATRWSPLARAQLFADIEPSERAVVVFYDPAEDLRRRAGAWGVAMERPHLDALAGFAAALADTEARSWEEDVPDVAMRAYETRRLLLGDRIAHWAVPWLDAIRRGNPEVAAEATLDRDALLDLGDEMRIAPILAGDEGLTAPGEDAFGPVVIDVPPTTLLRSVWSGDVLLVSAITSMRGGDVSTPSTLSDGLIAEPSFRTAVSVWYERAARRWRSLAEAHPGSAALWRDLAARAERTVSLLGEAG